MKVNNYLLDKIIDKYFTWEDVSNYKTSATGNVFCFHHPNNDTPAARLYFNEDSQLWMLYCYAERRGFYVHNYIQTVLIEEQQLYTSPLDFLRQHLSEGEIISQYKLFEKADAEFIETNFEKKKEYIDNCYNETGNVVDYIERLYNA